jgi:hypothetical protein
VLPSREKEQEMTDKIRIIGVGLAAMAGILLVSGVAWAQASQEPVSGEVGNFVVIEPGELWVDEDGVRHRRNRRTSEEYFGDIRGQQFKITRLNINLETGELDAHGSFTFEGFVGFVGEDRVKAKGRFTVLCTGGDPSFCEEAEIWHLEDGRKINLLETYILFSADPSVYEGTILDPPGGEKRNRPRSR